MAAGPGRPDEADLPGPPSSIAADATRLRLLYIGNPASVHVRRWAGFFAARGHDVHVAGLWDRGTEDETAPYPVHRLGRPATAAIGLNRLARRLAPDIVHAHYLTHYGWITWASMARPYVMTLWGSDVLIDARSSPLRRAWARVVLSGAALVTADSPDVMAAAVALGARSSRIREIQFGVDTDRFRPGPVPEDLAARLGLTGHRVVFAPRAITPLYRTEVILEAVATCPEDVVMVGTLAGADPASLARLRSAAANLGVVDRLMLVPPIPHGEIDQFYRLADVVVTVPASDGTPVSLVEAFASGIPVVASDLPSVRPWIDIVRPELLVPVGDAAATARAISLALGFSADERAALGADERAIALGRADQTTQMAVMESEYRGLLER